MASVWVGRGLGGFGFEMLSCHAFVMLLQAVDRQPFVVLEESSFCKSCSVQHSETSFEHSSICTGVFGGVGVFACDYTEN